MSTSAPRVNPYGATIFSQETKKMNMLPEKQLASLLSIDRNIEVALYPSGLEARVTGRMREELQAAIEQEKESTWLPIWKQLKGFMISNVSSLALNLVRFGSMALNELDSIQMNEDKLEIINTKQENLFGKTRLHFKVGKYEIDLRPGDPGVFDSQDVKVFANRVAEIKPLYLEYLKNIEETVS